MKKNYLTKAERIQFILTTEQKDILVGLILGDLNFRKAKGGVNALLKFEQGLIHKDYLLHLFDLFSIYCRTAPKTQSRVTRPGMEYSSVYFRTYSLPCFNEFLDLFYLEGKKIIPNNIGELLTPLGLAYWLCDDGGFCNKNRVIYLSTNCFTLAEVNLLVKTLNNKWNLNCTINKNGAGFRIRISSRSLAVIQELLKDIMPSMMLYKIGL
jgi:hypothetical protein